MQILGVLEAAKSAKLSLGQANSLLKDTALEAIAKNLESSVQAIMTANSKDLLSGESNKLAQSLLDRLTLDEARIHGLAAAAREIIGLPDPIGEITEGMTLANGLRLSKVRVPFGVVGCIYEARPNVTVDIAVLALKSGNVVLLRGGSAAIETNMVLVDLIQKALSEVGLPKHCVQTIDEFGREGSVELMRARGFVDVLIPRGSANLIKTVVTESKVPVIETGDGVVHIFVDDSAELDKALPLIINSKVQRPSVCNALETLLVHRAVAADLLPSLGEALSEAGVLVHGCEQTQEFIPGAILATEADWRAEYLKLELAIRVVEDLTVALEHIAKYSTHHTESILTTNTLNADRFLAEVDSAVVMVNASTRFTDGGEFGFGAEVGISTQKLHARGPMGLRELTSTKWLVRGSGQVRS